MKKKLILVFIIITNILFGQKINKDSLGLDYNPYLTEKESKYFNREFKDQLNNFDFTHKKIGFAFVEDNFLTNKKHFFRLKKDRGNNFNYKLIVLTDDEKIKSGGYDAFIIILKKNEQLTEKKRAKLIKAFSRREKSLPKNLYKLGLDNNLLLTKYEAEYFNMKFKDRGFDFNNKMIGFFIGNNGSSIQTKKEYFDRLKERLSHNYSASMDILIVLTEEQKIESGGFDAIIVSWSKLMVRGATQKMIGKLRESVTQEKM